jgi:hypothetical protein
VNLDLVDDIDAPPHLRCVLAAPRHYRAPSNRRQRTAHAGHALSLARRLK